MYGYDRGCRPSALDETACSNTITCICDCHTTISSWFPQIMDEYDRVCRPSVLDETPCSVAEQRQHALLNRYFNVLPFDFNRVRLQVQVPRCTGLG